MEYYSLNRYIRDTFGRKLYKIAIDAGMTCPNRDGTIGTGGCIFCDGGSGDFAQDRCFSVTEQIEKGKSLVKGKLGSAKEAACTNFQVGGTAGKVPLQEALNEKHKSSYIAYFQAYTNTYAPVETLRRLYEEAAMHPDIAAISIATRPDCLPDEVIGLLKDINKIKPVWVELGLQTMHDNTAEYIRRGYKLEVYDDAVRRLNEAGISQVITHIILGLPGEDAQMMVQSVEHAVVAGTTGIKLQLLHVLEGTDLAKDFAEGLFECLTMEGYTDSVIECLRCLKYPEKNIVVHRITGDGNKQKLIAPLWSGDKKRVLNYMKERIMAE